MAGKEEPVTLHECYSILDICSEMSNPEKCLLWGSYSFYLPLFVTTLVLRWSSNEMRLAWNMIRRLLLVDENWQDSYRLSWSILGFSQKLFKKYTSKMYHYISINLPHPITLMNPTQQCSPCKISRLQRAEIKRVSFWRSLRRFLLMDERIIIKNLQNGILVHFDDTLIVKYHLI